jgi:hypothetical protein
MKLSECWKGRVVTPVDLAADCITYRDTHGFPVPRFDGERPIVGHVDGFKFDRITGITYVLVNWGVAQYLSTFKPEALTPYED